MKKSHKIQLAILIPIGILLWGLIGYTFLFLPKNPKFIKVASKILYPHLSYAEIQLQNITYESLNTSEIEESKKVIRTLISDVKTMNNLNMGMKKMSLITLFNTFTQDNQMDKGEYETLIDLNNVHESLNIYQFTDVSCQKTVDAINALDIHGYKIPTKNIDKKKKNIILYANIDKNNSSSKNYTQPSYQLTLFNRYGLIFKVGRPYRFYYKPNGSK